MRKRDLLVTGMVALICGGILVLFTGIETRLLPRPQPDPAALKKAPGSTPTPGSP